jgi:hypothetical protein
MHLDNATPVVNRRAFFVQNRAQFATRSGVTPRHAPSSPARIGASEITTQKASYFLYNVIH